MVVKQLGISSHVAGVRELGVKLGCVAAVDLAREVLRKYKEEFVKEKYSLAQREGLDLEKPLYPAAALYCSCKSVWGGDKLGWGVWCILGLVVVCGRGGGGGGGRVFYTSILMSPTS